MLEQKNMTAPCAQCPWRKDVEPGFLGGSKPEVYIGQAVGPFVLPCHMGYPDTNDKARLCMESPQCAGAAIYRANNKIDYLPEPLLRLAPADEVFGSHVEFLAHHKRISLEQAELELRATTPEQHLARELRRHNTMRWAIPNKEKA